MDAQSRRLLRKPSFMEGLASLGEEHGLPIRQVRRSAKAALQEMWSRHNAFESLVWDQIGTFFLRNYDVMVDEAKIKELAALDAEHPLLILFSHRSYLDDWLVGHGLHRAGIQPMFILAGANLDFFPLGGLIRRTGGLFIRRSMKGDPVYKYVLRSYLAHLMEHNQNIGWSIEGGRTRTGKLRPPRYGVLNYAIQAMRKHDGPEPYIVPVSVVYDQLSEVATMAAEALGASKKPEGIGWILRFTQMQRQKGGVARVDFGDPMPLRAEVSALEEDPRSRDILVERVALSVCHRINQATPATPTAVVTLAFLAAERGLTVPEVMEAEQTRVREMAIDINGFRTTGNPIKMSRTPAKADRKKPPKFGEETRAVRAEIGYSQDEIEAMITAGAALDRPKS
ncbi:MAG: 1-acyl-sn-glycerol-3-phosphate acyltransferase [Myxococcota bacterium]